MTDGSTSLSHNGCNLYRPYLNLYFLGARSNTVYGLPYTMFLKDGLDGLKNCKANPRVPCHENMLVQSFETSPHFMGLADYLCIPFMASLIQT